jgi:hypothetical protein
MRNQTQIIGEDWFTYTAKVEALNFGTTANDTINIQANSDFVLYKTTYIVFGDLTTSLTDSSTLVPHVNVQLTDTGSGQQLFSEAIPISTVAGTGERPFILPKPRTLRANTTLVVAFENFSTVLNYDLVYLQFIGQKIFTPGPN